MVELEGRVLQAPKLQYGGKVSKLVFLILDNCGGTNVPVIIVSVAMLNICSVIHLP